MVPGCRLAIAAVVAKQLLGDALSQALRHMLNELETG
jgi:hypothetical protein